MLFRAGLNCRISRIRRIRRIGFHRTIGNGFAPIQVLVAALYLSTALQTDAVPSGSAAALSLERAAGYFEAGYRYQTGDGTGRNLRRALTFYAQALSVYPEGYPRPFAVLYNTALIHAELKQNQKAQVYFIRAVRAARELGEQRRSPSGQELARHSEALARNGLGSCYQRDGKLVEAEQQYRIGIQFCPELVETHFNLLNLLSQQQRWDDMEEALEAARAMAPSSNYEIFTGRRGGRTMQRSMGRKEGLVGLGLVSLGLLGYVLLTRLQRRRS